MTLTVGTNDVTSTFFGPIQDLSGTLSLDKVGIGTVTLAGVNAYNGDTTIDAGTLRMGADDAIPYGSNVGNVYVNSSGTLDLAGHTINVNGLFNSVDGGGIVDNSTGSGMLIVGDNDVTDDTFNGAIRNSSGTLALTKVGTDTLTFGGNVVNTYTGGTTINAGTLATSNIYTLPIGGDLYINANAYFDFGASCSYIGSLSGDGIISHSRRQ